MINLYNSPDFRSDVLVIDNQSNHAMVASHPAGLENEDGFVALTVARQNNVDFRLDVDDIARDLNTTGPQASMTPEETRVLALALLQAADRAEGIYPAVTYKVLAHDTAGVLVTRENPNSGQVHVAAELGRR